jgi:hypothetical protein
MKNSVAKFATVLGLLVGVLALTLPSASFAQRNGCIPQYDSSGAQTAPYC